MAPGFCAKFKTVVGMLFLPVALLVILPGATAASIIFEKLIVGGDPNAYPSDSPVYRVDPNIPSSIWAGVGSLEVTSLAGVTYLGSGTPISPNHILTAGHLLDLDDDGSIDTTPGDVQFHLNYNGDNSSVITARSLAIHPSFTGFNNDFVNDDIAIVTLSNPLPAGVPLYNIFRGTLPVGEPITMVGYGRSGDGAGGYTGSASFTVKRVGFNNADGFLMDDEGTDINEVFIFDFDFPDDSYENYANYMGGPSRGNTIEAQFGPGDSGGPSFIYQDEQWLLVGVNTFGGSFVSDELVAGPEVPFFGSGGGGMVVSAYADWIDGVAVNAPIPSAVWLLGSGLVGIAVLLRK